MQSASSPSTKIRSLISNTQLASQNIFNNTAGLDTFLQEPNHKKALTLWYNTFSENRNNSTNKLTTQQLKSQIMRDINKIDNLVSEQINCILHDQRFQKLEASWRGVEKLVDQIPDATTNVKIKLLNITWQEVAKDISRAIEFDQSQLFKKIYSEEFGTPGGEPYGALIGDYEIRHLHDDISTLEGMSQIAAAAFSPFIANVSHELFGIDDFASLAMPLAYNDIFSQPEYIKWRSYRDKPDSRFVALTLPKILMRKPYNKRTQSYNDLMFRENVSSKTNNNYLWGNSCYAFAQILIREFISTGWFGHIRGAPRGILGGGIVTDYPSTSFDTDPGNVAVKPRTDVIITENVERKLAEQGFIPLCCSFDNQITAFYSNQTTQKPKLTQDTLESTNFKLSSMMQHILCCSRIAHYVKVIVRDKIGSYSSPQDCQQQLQDWLHEYSLSNEELDWGMQAKYPLRDARVEVKADPLRPEIYMCIIYVKPRYQLDQLVSELELVTEIASKATH